MFAAGFGLSAVGRPKAFGDWAASEAGFLTKPAMRSAESHTDPRFA